jgi:uncharacterized protein (UPF0332 family)
MVERVDREEGLLRARAEMARSREELEAARRLREKGFYFKSVSPSYYAIYHAAKALLLLRGVDPRTHEWVERMFALYYLKTGEFELNVGKAIGRLVKMRQEADNRPGNGNKIMTLDANDFLLYDFRRKFNSTMSLFLYECNSILAILRTLHSVQLLTTLTLNIIITDAKLFNKRVVHKMETWGVRRRK